VLVDDLASHLEPARRLARRRDGCAPVVQVDEVSTKPRADRKAALRGGGRDRLEVDEFGQQLRPEVAPAPRGDELLRLCGEA
jgi:hypothetical protein